MGSTPSLLYTILCVVFEARVINLCDRDIATKPLTKTESLVSQKSSSTPTSTTDFYIFYAHALLLTEKQLTKTRSLAPKNHPRSRVLWLTLTSSTHIEYSWLRNIWQKLSPLCPKNHPRILVLRLAQKSSMNIDYCWLRNHLRKLGPWDPKITQEAQFYGWRWHLLRT